jgi:hypothetical protein
MSKTSAAKVINIGGEAPTNGAAEIIEISEPTLVAVKIEGSSDLLFHRWNVEGVDERAKAGKGSKAKKTDDLESFVYRLDNRRLAIPGEYLRQSIIHAAKFKQDPRSPRKSAMDLFKAGLVCLTPLADLGVSKWDYEDRRRVLIQRNAINRTRPALKAGWRAQFQFLINLPEYITPALFQAVVSDAGRLVGVGDFRPTYGRFTVVKFDLVKS